MISIQSLGYCIIKTLLIISIIILSVSPSQSNNFFLESVTQLKWENRIILVRPKNNLKDVLLDFKIAKSKILDRHINWFVFFEDKIYTNYKGDIAENFNKNMVRKYFSVASLSMVLIGKDGTVKQEAKDFNLNAFFELIDSMPMRKIEMEN
ncbi:MAG: DUF4174 domain-containing protein [Gammaproteobacteria bacterium]|nr:DUF4174 domain-containing protein [Gammaproteobacteria bacterium]